MPAAPPSGGRVASGGLWPGIESWTDGGAALTSAYTGRGIRGGRCA